MYLRIVPLLVGHINKETVKEVIRVLTDVRRKSTIIITI